MKIISYVLLLALFSCSSEKKEDKNNSKSEKTSEKIETEKEEKKHWEYEGESGPEHWAEIEGNSFCAGQHQSPINISQIDLVQGHDSLVFNISNYKYEDFSHISSVTNNGHSIQYNFDSENNSIDFNGNTYSLIQFHFHSPAEHTVSGVRFPLETHLVHYNKEIDEYIVIANFIKEGDKSDDLEFLEHFLPIAVGETKEINKEYCFYETLSSKNNAGYAHYKGSLTTPPCTENVNWLISDTPNEVSHEQIKILQELMPHNNYRGEQELNGRKVYKL